MISKWRQCWILMFSMSRKIWRKLMKGHVFARRNWWNSIFDFCAQRKLVGHIGFCVLAFHLKMCKQIGKKIKLCSVFYELLNEIAKCGESWDEKFQQQRHFVNQQCSRVLSIFEWEQRLSLLFNALTGLLCWQRRRSPRRTVFCGCSWTDESSFRVKGLLACIFFLFAAVCGWSYKSSFCFWVGNKGENLS